LIGALFLAWCPPAAAETVAGLYRGEAIVTGQENLEERRRGFREALQEVIVKVTGHSRLAEDRRLASALADAGDYVAAFEYEDRLAKKKLMDEQGTRERSWFLRVDFDPTKVDRLVAELGARPWGADRPRVLVLLGIRDTLGPYVLSSEGERGYGQRQALLSIAGRRGVPVVLPRTGADEALVDTESVAADTEAIARRKVAYRADVVLLGTMTITPEGVWDTEWALLPGHEQHRWRIDGTTFDRAIADGIEGSARILAGAE
jgi:hypothetical protein